MFPLLLSLSVLVQGADPSAKLPGEWKVKSVSLPVTGPYAEKARATMMGFKITFAKDKTFAMFLGGPMKGTWKLKGNEVALSISEIAGKKMSEIIAMARTNYANEPSPSHKAQLDELSRPLIATLGTDGKTLTIKPSSGKAGFVFVRA